jgi:cell division protein FtsI/penicillin-binding protein 2
MTEHAKTNVRRRRKLQAEKRRKVRLLLLVLVMFLGSGALVYHKDKLSPLTEMLDWLKQKNPQEVIASTVSPSFRGDIYDRNFSALAATFKTYAIYARPLEMEDPDSSATILAEILQLKKHKLLPNLKSERGFIWVAKGIDPEIANAIKQQDIKGIYQVVETKRYYPNFNKAAHVVGFVENDQGLDGIEFQYNTILRGDETSSTELKTLNFPPGTDFGETSTHLVLNLDLMIQSKIEHFLDKRMKITGASSGAAILMNADTGAILAMASFPSFNPNRYWEFSSSALKNHALTEPVYPGELGLIFQQAASFNLKNEKKNKEIGCLDEADPVIVIGPEILKRRKLSVAPRVDEIDTEYFLQFTQSLGFNQKNLTDLPLKDETPVSTSLILTNPSFKSSALRLLNGFTALVNGGKLVTPHLLHKAYQKTDNTQFETALNVSKKKVVLNPDTTKDLTDFLVSKWLKRNKNSRTSDAPMFFEAHKYATPVKSGVNQISAKDENELPEEIPYLSQSVMLGAIPGKEPKLTMIAVLSYPDSCDGVHPEALEAFGNKFSLLSPDQDMIQKMLHVAAMQSPNPSPNFWDGEGAMIGQNSDFHSDEITDSAALSDILNKSMPDVTGKSLRAGLQVLQHLNLDIKLTGSGRIVSQQPSAGTELIDVSECTLEMQQEI